MFANQVSKRYMGVLNQITLHEHYVMPTVHWNEKRVQRTEGTLSVEKFTFVGKKNA